MKKGLLCKKAASPPPGDPGGAVLRSPITAPPSALERWVWKTRNMGLQYIRNTSLCKNPVTDAGGRTKICYLFTGILERERHRGEKIPRLSMQGSGRSPSPAPPEKLSVPVFPAGTTSVSTARCSQQQNNSCTIQAATEWLNSSLYRHGVIKT